MEQGQILRGSNLGELIYNLTKRKDVKDIVEIGTWFGMGSTKCVIDGIIDSNTTKNFVSVELYPEKYNEAIKNLDGYLSHVKLLNGSIIDYDDMFWFNFDDLDQNIHMRKWYDDDLDKLKTSKNVLDELSPTIDLLILDGGEFSTYPEWLKLKNRTKIVILDDTNVLKCKKIVEELSNDNNYLSLHIVPNERNGFCIFEKKK